VGDADDRGVESGVQHREEQREWVTRYVKHLADRNYREIRLEWVSEPAGEAEAEETWYELDHAMLFFARIGGVVL